MITPIPEGIDPIWWAEHTKQVAREYCPICEPDVDPVKETVAVSYCNEHHPKAFGKQDQDVKAPTVSLGNTDAMVVHEREEEQEHGQAD